MDLYDVVITKKAEEMLEKYVDYIFFTLLNEQAARSVLRDARETQEKLKAAAASLPYCTHSVLRERGIRAINFRRHRYVMLYRIEEKTAFVVAIYHQRQDYEKIFARDLD